MALFAAWPYAVGSVVLAVLIFVTHRDNIRRLLKGEEPRIGDKKPAPTSDGSSSTSP
jgi:glycerol-3-phosphate acyltransferase PlsY